jgi:hypothetical protein
MNRTAIARVPLDLVAHLAREVCAAILRVRRADLDCEASQCEATWAESLMCGQACPDEDCPVGAADRAVEAFRIADAARAKLADSAPPTARGTRSRAGRRKPRHGAGQAAGGAQNP